MDRTEWLYHHYSYDYILQKHEARDFTQFVVSTGGDVSVFRVYGSNEHQYKIYER